MKITILKQITSLLMILGLVGVLVTSCEREIIIEEDIDGFKTNMVEGENLELNNEEINNLAKRISKSDEFLNLIQIQKELSFNTESGLKNTNIEDRQTTSIVFNLKNLYENFAVLNNINDELLTNLFELSFSNISNTSSNTSKKSNICGINTGDCKKDCYSCYLWLNNQDYAAALSQIRQCIRRGGNYNNCVNQAMNWYNQASQDNYNYYLSCWYNC